MLALRVVEHLDVIEHVAPCFPPVQVGPAADALALEQLKETLRHRIVVAVATPAHAGDEIVRLQKCLPVVTAELAALVLVDDDGLGRLASPDRHQERVDREFPIHARLHRPSDHLTREEIKHYGQIQPALVSADVGDVGHPDPIRLGHVELLLHVVRCHDRRAAVTVARAAPVASLRTQTFSAHQAVNSVLAGDPAGRR